MAEPIASREAKYGEKMIEIKVRFWTNGIAREGQIQPKQAWSSGVIGIARNETHGIIPGHSRPFNSLMEISTVIEEVLMEHGIVLRRDHKMAKYIR